MAPTFAVSSDNELDYNSGGPKLAKIDPGKLGGPLLGVGPSSSFFLPSSKLSRHSDLGGEINHLSVVSFFELVDSNGSKCAH